jgi:glycosyltransferase involved in cell wall biosynthesis
VVGDRGLPGHAGPQVAARDIGDLRVLRVIGALNPELGGTSAAAVSACIASQRCGVSNTIVFAAAAGSEEDVKPTEDRLRSEGVRVKRFRILPLVPTYVQPWGVSAGLCRWVMRHAGRFDVIHIHQAWGLAQIIALMAAKLWSRPCLITPHESMTNYDVDREKTLLKSLLKRVYLKAVSGIEVSSSLEQADSIPPRYLWKSRILPHPVDADTRRPPPEIGRGAGEPLIAGFLGRLHPKKNVDVLIRAVALDAFGTRLRIAGDGPEPLKRTLADCATDNGVEDRVEWLGFVPAGNRAAFLRDIDVLVLASDYECFGVAVAEAMAHGVPVIVSKRTGVAAMVAKYGCGIVIDPTPPRVAAALELIRTDERYAAQLGSQGRVAVQEELSMAAYGTAALSGYESLVAARRVRRGVHSR